MSDKILINENTTGANAPNVATTDENLSVNNMFQQNLLPSLGRQIFPVIPAEGPTAAVFNIRRKVGSTDMELVRAEVEMYPSNSIKSGLTQEVVSDLITQYGKKGEKIVGELLRGLANEDENTKTIAFLETNAVANANLQLTDSLNARTNISEVVQYASELILKMNTINTRTYKASVVLPYKIAASVMGLGTWADGCVVDGDNGLFVAKIGATKFYMNPVPASTTAYVVLHDDEEPSKSSAIFTPYIEEVRAAMDPDTGNENYFIYNRYAITLSPLNATGDELVQKFTILL